MSYRLISVRDRRLRLMTRREELGPHHEYAFLQAMNIMNASE